MYLVTEKKLLQKNYRGYHNVPNTVYISNISQTKQISMEKIMLEDYSVGWKVSFPLKSSIMNYATLFRTESAAKDYLENLVNDYI
tara:strand:+ start:1356 stop:1610 length:255 start_codon:yes stop_codon:yes gene_type:complete